MSLSTKDIIEAVASVVDGGAPLHAPEIAGREWEYVKDCLDTEWVSSVGAYVDRFEDMLCDITGARYAIATCSGTAALHTCFLLVGVQPGDEVIVPDLSFVATANAVSYIGAIPHFADSEEATLGIDPEKLDRYLAENAIVENGVCRNRASGRRIAAVTCMHTFGHPVRIAPLKAVCARYGLPLVEDAAESLGSYVDGRHTGCDGVVSALSFNGNKIVTTGGGGAILTGDEDLAARAKHLTTTAKVPDKWEFIHDDVGYNYRLPNVSAAIGCAQLERLDDFLARKRRVAAAYTEAFSDLAEVVFFVEPMGCRSNYWLNVILLSERQEDRRDDVLAALNDAGFMSRPAWRPLSALAPYANCPRMDLTVSQSLYRRLINLPSSPRLVDADASS